MTSPIKDKAKDRYEKKRAKISVSFNLDDPDNVELLNYARTLNFSLWAKEKLRNEMLEKRNMERN